MKTTKESVTFEIGDLVPIVVTLAVAGLVAAFTLQVVGDVKETQGDQACTDAGKYWNTTSQRCEVSAVNSALAQGNPADYNASLNTINGLAVIPEKFGIIATVSVAAVVIGLLLTYFLGRLVR